MAVLPRHGDELEQSFLERTQLDVGQAEPNEIHRLCEFGARAKLVGVVVDEIAAFPVRVEDCGYLRECIWVPHARQADVPFQPSTCAEWVRFDEPTYAVEYSPLR